MHSDHSDGTEPPAEVMRAAYEAGVRTAALTDHDTITGWAAAARAARGRGMTFIPGAEISTRHGGGSVHVLAYLFDPEAARLAALMRRVREDRVVRAERFVARLARDLPITWDAVLKQRTGDATVGRPHIADALIAQGIVASREEAFARLLSPSGKYYVGHYAPSPREVVEAIVAAGGVAIIAHPAGRGMLSDAAITHLIDAGLAGFELAHRENSAEGVAHLRRFVAKHDLIVTGASDYHGEGKPNRPGENTTSAEMVERILARATGTEVISG